MSDQALGLCQHAANGAICIRTINHEGEHIMASDSKRDYRDRVRKLSDHIFGTPQENIDAYNEGVDYALNGSAPGSAPYSYVQEEDSPGQAFWDGVHDGTKKISALVNALGDESTSKGR